jgi:hypothetical protein
VSEPVRVGEPLAGVVGELVERAGHGSARWAELVAQAGYCHHPIRLTGRVEHADRQTGEVRTVYDSEREPDGVLLKACGTRRERLVAGWRGVDDEVVAVVAGGVVEAAGTGDQAEQRLGRGGPDALDG